MNEPKKKKVDGSRTPNKQEELAEINKARVRIGLAPLEPRSRKCLNCGESFESLDKRVCPACHYAATYKGYSTWD